MAEIVAEFLSGRSLGLAGVGALLLIAIIFSNNRRAINPRVVLSAFALQAVMAWFALATPVGSAVIGAMSAGVTHILGYANAGISLLFGPISDSKNFGVVFAFQVLPIVIFFAALMSVLYHLRVMQLVVAGVGGLLRVVLGTRPVESLNAAANIFVGQTEAPLAVKPYLDRITGPQLFAIMVSGLASVAGSVLAAYAQIGIDLDYLLAASFMAAPGGLLMAKIIIPDGKESGDNALDIFAIVKERSPHPNVIMAAAVGAKDGLALALNIGAMLLAFTGLIALVNGLLGALGDVIGVDGLSAQMILGWAFAPLMALLNIPWTEAVAAGGIFGEKIILNEFIAYFSLVREAPNLDPRTVSVLTFALCGFANISSIAILLGGLGSLMPERMGDIARFGVRAVLAGSLSNLMSAALASLILT
ncbi:MAG TPA: NupC/NupG family nucleoside CNT transporter [Parvularcula sp.]|nr:NupC/NupG family nucleoside CNT transporter [Parvularcula sp.]HBS31353.1 NupC/NupG family nucleoside CNT transporter [Parvularcula sp.]HBS34221.1 NupC/NupG family nucleoside CNT transporter [Parvularcula sp.]